MTRQLDPETDEPERLARAADMQEMAKALLDDPESAAAFQRVGLSGDFTLQERKAIYERLGLGSYDPYDNIIIALDYQAVIQALARRVAAGVYRTVFDNEANAWVLSNTFVGAYQLSSGRNNPFREKRIAFEDFLIVLREYMAWDELPEHLNALRTHVFDPHSEHDQDEQLHEIAEPLYTKSREIFRKYGHIGTFTVVHVASALIREGKTAEDIDAVGRHAADDPAVRIEGISWHRESGLHPKPSAH